MGNTLASVAEKVQQRTVDLVKAEENLTSTVQDGLDYVETQLRLHDANLEKYLLQYQNLIHPLITTYQQKFYDVRGSAGEIESGIAEVFDSVVNSQFLAKTVSGQTGTAQDALTDLGNVVKKSIKFITSALFGSHESKSMSQEKRFMFYENGLILFDIYVIRHDISTVQGNVVKTSICGIYTRSILLSLEKSNFEVVFTNILDSNADLDALKVQINFVSKLRHKIKQQQKQMDTKRKSRSAANSLRAVGFDDEDDDLDQVDLDTVSNPSASEPILPVVDMAVTKSVTNNLSPQVFSEIQEFETYFANALRACVVDNASARLFEGKLQRSDHIVGFQVVATILGENIQNMKNTKFSEICELAQWLNKPWNRSNISDHLNQEKNRHVLGNRPLTQEVANYLNTAASSVASEVDEVLKYSKEATIVLYVAEMLKKSKYYKGNWRVRKVEV